jgi:hypothetical protein
MSNELALTTLDDIIKVSQIVAKGKNFGGIDANIATIKILAGQEMGLGAVASLNGLYIYKDSIGVQSSVMSGLIKSSPKYHYDIVTEPDDDRKCEIEFFENGKKIGVSRFTIEEAERAGLLSKDNWKKYPADMLFSRTISRGFKRYCPDLGTGPVYTKEEIDSFEPEPEDLVIEGAILEGVTNPGLSLDTGRQKWIESIMASEDFPKDGSPVDKVAFINAELDTGELDVAPVTVPELLGNGG